MRPTSPAGWVSLPGLSAGVRCQALSLPEADDQTVRHVPLDREVAGEVVGAGDSGGNGG